MLLENHFRILKERKFPLVGIKRDKLWSETYSIKTYQKILLVVILTKECIQLNLNNIS